MTCLWVSPSLVFSEKVGLRIKSFISTLQLQKSKLQPFSTMSLSLIQGYSSGEDEPQHDQTHLHDSSSDDDDEDAGAGEPSAAGHPSLGDRSIFDLPQPSSASGLPSAFDAFSEVNPSTQWPNPFCYPTILHRKKFQIWEFNFQEEKKSLFFYSLKICSILLRVVEFWVIVFTFMEVSGPPQFLNNSVEDYNPARDADQQQGRHGSRRNRKDKKDLPTGIISFSLSLSLFSFFFSLCVRDI